MNYLKALNTDSSFRTEYISDKYRVYFSDNDFIELAESMVKSSDINKILSELKRIAEAHSVPPNKKVEDE